MRTRAHFPKAVRKLAREQGTHMVCITVVGTDGSRQCEIIGAATPAFALKAYRLAKEGARMAIGSDPTVGKARQVSSLFDVQR